MLLFLRHKAFTKDNSMGMRMRIVNSLLNTFLYTYFFYCSSICWAFIFYGKCHLRTKNRFCVGRRQCLKLFVKLFKEIFFTLTSILERIMNMPKSTTSPWCKSTNPEPTSDSQEDSLDDRMVSGYDTTIDRHPYQVKIPEKYIISQTSLNWVFK